MYALQKSGDTSDVFENGGAGRTDATGYSFYTAVREGVENKERLKLLVQKYLPANYQINLLTLYDFFFFANEARKSPPKSPNK